MLLWWLGIGEDAEDLGGRRPLSSGHGVGMAKRGGKVPSMGGLEKEETRKKKLRARTNPRSSVGGTTDEDGLCKCTTTASAANRGREGGRAAFPSSYTTRCCFHPRNWGSDDGRSNGGRADGGRAFEG